ncbi:hypothetical protein SLEP1_g32275 [Rubroshorea leprosula]|uniref:Uncharacterized protein n=1 Tax=Rubroshorea leprosula TaxID=152421 RepID=A0AAV5KCR9_9ROSI|nr:hypothetical protein SLEP1_g32275 [Rubroshorea leprosula]
MKIGFKPKTNPIAMQRPKHQAHLDMKRNPNPMQSASKPGHVRLRSKAVKYKRRRSEQKRKKRKKGIPSVGPLRRKEFLDSAAATAASIPPTEPTTGELDSAATDSFSSLRLALVSRRGLQEKLREEDDPERIMKLRNGSQYDRCSRW